MEVTEVAHYSNLIIDVLSLCTTLCFTKLKHVIKEWKRKKVHVYETDQTEIWNEAVRVKQRVTDWHSGTDSRVHGLNPFWGTITVLNFIETNSEIYDPE